MEKIQSTKRACVTDTEMEKVSWSCEAKDVLSDIKFFMREYYVGFYDENGENLIVQFNNGQKFSISVAEVK